MCACLFSHQCQSRKIVLLLHSNSPEIIIYFLERKRKKLHEKSEVVEQGRSSSLTVTQT